MLRSRTVHGGRFAHGVLIHRDEPDYFSSGCRSPQPPDWQIQIARVRLGPVASNTGGLLSARHHLRHQPSESNTITGRTEYRRNPRRRVLSADYEKPTVRHAIPTVRHELRVRLGHYNTLVDTRRSVCRSVQSTRGSHAFISVDCCLAQRLWPSRRLRSRGGPHLRTGRL